jgi:DeoR/GlpR family transcriptional regulator of sugar metabolism
VLAVQRRQHIARLLQRQGKVLVAELSDSLGVSPDTVRRDLQALADAGLLLRVHGGALPRTPSAMEFSTREKQAPERKAALARATAALFRSGQIIVIDGGTTQLRVAEEMPHDLQATVITNSPSVALALSGHPRIEVHMTPGRLHKATLTLLGASTVDALRGIHADICVLGVGGVHPEVGVSVPATLEEVAVKRAMVAGAAEVVAVATAEKIGAAAPFVVAPIEELTHLVTEASVPAAALAPYRERGITLIQG